MPIHDYPYEYDDDLNLSDLEEDTSDIPEEDPVDSTVKSLYEKPFIDMLIHAEVLIPQGEGFKPSKLKVTYKDCDGKQSFTFDQNPLLNSIIYNVGFLDGDIKQYATNTIAQNIYSQIDSDCYYHTVLETIIYHSKNYQAVVKDYKYFTTFSVNQRLRKTTIGWNIIIQCNFGI